MPFALVKLINRCRPLFTPFLRKGPEARGHAESVGMASPSGIFLLFLRDLFPGMKDGKVYSLSRLGQELA